MKRRLVMLRLWWMRGLFQVLGWFAPGIGARWAYRLWYTTHRFPEPLRERRVREKAEGFVLQHTYGQIAGYRWGEANRPLVLCVHGWNGRAAQLGSIIDAFVQDGYRVVGFDAPGHGRSDRQATNIFEIASVLHSIIEQEGMPTIMLGHSFGCMVLAYAIRHQGLTPARLVFISAPTSTRYLIDQFAHMLRIPARSMRIFHANLQRQFGEDVYEHISAEQNMRGCNIPLLIIHDKQDQAVSWRNSQRVADVAAAVTTLYTEGLGHRRILRNQRVIKQILEFCRGTKHEQDTTTL